MRERNPAYRGHNAWHSGFLIIDARDLCSVIVRDIVHVAQNLIRITLRDYRVRKRRLVRIGRFPLAVERARGCIHRIRIGMIGRACRLQISNPD